MMTRTEDACRGHSRISDEAVARRQLQQNAASQGTRLLQTLVQQARWPKQQLDDGVKQTGTTTGYSDKVNQTGMTTAHDDG